VGLDFDEWPDFSYHIYESRMATRALERLCDALTLNGWEATDRGAEWYSQRFRRKRAAIADEGWQP
jgi:hypothetical protein